MSPLRERILLSLIPSLGYAYIRLLHATMRLEFRNREVLRRVREEFGQYILVFWHSRFVMMPYCYPDRRLVVLSSEHRDSQMLARILGRFGLVSAWGSSTSGGAKGLRQLLRKIKEGYDVGLTPDGPRGPRRRVKQGIMITAKLSGLPIIPVTFSARRARRLRSWDRTLLPLPFARGLFLYGEPLTLARNASEDEVDRSRLELEAEMDRLTDLADREVGIEPEPPRSEEP